MKFQGNCNCNQLHLHVIDPNSYVRWMRCEEQIQCFVLSCRKINHLFQAVIWYYVKEDLADSGWILGSFSPHGLPVDVMEVEVTSDQEYITALLSHQKINILSCLVNVCFICSIWRPIVGGNADGLVSFHGDSSTYEINDFTAVDVPQL